MTARDKQLGLQLMNAVISGDDTSVNRLLNDGLNPSLVLRHPDLEKTCALKEALRAEQFEIASLLISRGADVQFVDECDQSVVSFALELA